MKKTVIVTGIPGTGKTTVCSNVQKLAAGFGVKIDIMNYGTVMMDILQKSGRLLDRDAMRKDDVYIQRDLQKQVAEAIVEKTRSSVNITIVDTHMSIKTPQGYFPGMSSNNLPLLSPDMLVLVEAKPVEISCRRMKDKDRKRDPALEDIVKEELSFSRSMAASCAVLMSIPIKVVINAEGKPEEAAKDILEALGVK